MVCFRCRSKIRNIILLGIKCSMMVIATKETYENRSYCSIIAIQQCQNTAGKHPTMMVTMKISIQVRKIYTVYCSLLPVSADEQHVGTCYYNLMASCSCLHDKFHADCIRNLACAKLKKIKDSPWRFMSMSLAVTTPAQKPSFSPLSENGVYRYTVYPRKWP